MSAKQDFMRYRHNMRQLKRSLIDVIEVESEQHFSRNFDREAWHGSHTKPWEPRKDGDTTRRILVQSGDLRKAATTAKRTERGVRYVLNQVYAQVHNEGGRAGRGAGFDMPRRQFIGRSTQLNYKIIKKMKEVIDNYFKNPS